MFAAPPRCRPWIGPALAAAWGLAAVVLLAGLSLGLATGPWPVRATLAAGLAVAAAGWGWRNAPGHWRGWVATAPLAGWTIGAFGWDGATVSAVAVWIALLAHTAMRRGTPPAARLRPYQPDAQASAVGAAVGLPDAPPELALRAGRGKDASFEMAHDDPELEDDELEDCDPEEPEPDQWFARTADAVEGELLVLCEGGVGSAHVLFWPALPGVPRVRCHPADGLGRVRASRVLPQGVRFEVVRPDGETGPVRVCYEAAV